jgi:uncharacterized protein YndB with AHSA1/START domain
MDRIEKQVVLKAPIERVWRAISDANQFGVWFGVELDGAFVVGQRISGRMRPTQVDAEVATRQEAFRGLPIEWQVEAVEPMRRFAFRWHPHAIDRNADYSSEPTTLVEFELAEAPGGTRLVIRESGFDKIPLERRAKAFAANDGGWSKQAELVEKYLVREPAR